MRRLRQAIDIFSQYGEDDPMVCCVGDMLCIDIDPSIVSKTDKAALQQLGFAPNVYENMIKQNCFITYNYST